MFRIDNLGINVTMAVSDTFQLKKVKYFTKKNKQHKFENKGICGIILNCASPSTQTKVTSVYNANKKAKTNYQPTKAYHRWFLCADVMNPPHTFVIVTHNHHQTCTLLRHVHDTSFVGMPFYLVEPNLSTSRVGDYLHVLEHHSPLYPLRTNARILAKPAPVDLPNGSDQTYFFVLEGEPIKLTRMKYTTNTCTGYQCDRHWGKDGCVCAYGSMGNSLVYEFEFQFPVNEKQFKYGRQVAPLSSFKTMSVFFNNLIEYTHTTTGEKEEKVLFRRRSQVRRLIDYVNTAGGWKIVGWCKRGLLSIDGEAEKVENTEVNLRLTSVFPQNEDILQDPMFRALRIKEDFDMFDHQLPNLSRYIPSDSSDSDSDESRGGDSNDDHDENLLKEIEIRDKSSSRNSDSSSSSSSSGSSGSSSSGDSGSDSSGSSSGSSDSSTNQNSRKGDDTTQTNSTVVSGLTSNGDLEEPIYGHLH